ncbi:ATP-binding cassette domain-containing protein [Sulfurisphaera tokodaii]|uniref:ABC transporter domain-containing protein n=1 Tax=Sulfurisphaera tokodaii (strain DSM 16993 / JCM 10545 / NBRC 100140 / 7) TaxID=273063 RepID=Q973U6_SULTO|nr:hypothetical protein STK_08020 [Sulfurisphaera tokodaii str. 7]
MVRRAILLLVASLSTGFSITLTYHSSALAYYLRFSKLKMYNYVLSLFLGPNGSGKMTLLRAISGIIPYKDSIKINGKEVRSAKDLLEYFTNREEVYNIGNSTWETYIYEA